MPVTEIFLPEEKDLQTRFGNLFITDRRVMWNNVTVDNAIVFSSSNSNRFTLTLIDSSGCALHKG